MWMSIRRAALLALLLAGASTAHAQAPQRCDVNADGAIDRQDLTLVQAAVVGREAVSGPADPRDANADGALTSTDLVTCRSLCTVRSPLCNSKPVADAGRDQAAFVGQTVFIDGTRSIDPDGQPLTYAWAIVTRPAGSLTQLSNPSVVRPTFAPDLEGDYLLQLVVSDGTLSSAPAQVLVSTAPDADVAPVANAGPDRVATVGQAVGLDGSGSTDLDGDALTYAWLPVSAPTGSTAALDDPTRFNPTLVPDVPGEYVFDLIVSDGVNASQPDRVVVRTDAVNQAPMADAGSDRSVLPGAALALSASGSSDPEGATLRYRWSLVAKPAGSTAALSGATTSAPTFTPDVANAQYVVQLIVNDGRLDSAPDVVVITTRPGNSAPVAVAGPDQQVSAADGLVVNLDGAGSFDPDGDGLTYRWSLLRQPLGSPTALGTPNFPGTTLPILRAGDYVAQLIVNDGTVDSAPDTALISTLNTPPVANAGADQTVAQGASVTLDGTGSFDADGDGLTYSWTFTTQPPGGVTTITNPNFPTASFNAQRAGIYVAQLAVNDGTVDASDTSSITVNVPANRPPVANNDSATTPEDTAVTIPVLANDSDPDGDPLTITSVATPPSGTAAIEGTSPVQSIRYTPAAGTRGLVAFSYVISDGRGGTSSASVSVNVRQVDATPPTAVLDASPNPSSPEQAVTVSAARSSDAAPGRVVRYRFTLLAPEGFSRPGGLTEGVEVVQDTPVVSLFGAVSANTPVPLGRYVVQLVVDDDAGSRSTPVTVAVIVRDATPPTAVLDASPNPSVAGATVTLSGARSGDVWGRVAVYTFTLLSAPSSYVAGAGLSVGVPVTADTGSLTLMPNAAGEYIIQLVVGDDSGNSSAPASVTLTVNEPSARLVADPMSLDIDTQSGGGVVITLPSPAGSGTRLTVSSGSARVTVPASVEVRAGRTDAYFSVISGASAGEDIVTISDGVNTVQVPVRIVAKDLVLRASTRGRLLVNDEIELTTVLPAPAPAGGAQVSLSSTAAGVVELDSDRILIAQGEVSGTVRGRALAVGAADVTAALIGGAGRAQRRSFLVASGVRSSITKTSSELIDDARAAGQISTDDALVYQVLAAYAPAELPPQFVGAEDAALHSDIGRRLTAGYSALSETAKNRVLPYLIPPGYEPVAAAAPLALRVAARATAPAAALVPPEILCSPVGPIYRLRETWAIAATAHFNVHYDSTRPEDVRRARVAAGAAEAIYQSLTTLMGRFPLSDLGFPCNGEDGAVDIWLDDRGALGGQTTQYDLTKCGNVPSWIRITPLSDDEREVRATLAHEFMHVLQFVFEKGDPCSDRGWLDEASATWAMDYVYPETIDNYEHNFADSFTAYDAQNGLGSRLREFRIPLDRTLPRPATRRSACRSGYCEYPLLFFVARKYGEGFVKRTYEALALFDETAALDTGLSPLGGFAKIIPEFASASWNDWRGKHLDDFYKWDDFARGIAPEYVKPASSVTGSPDERSISMRLNGVPERVVSSEIVNELQILDSSNRKQAFGFARVYRLATQPLHFVFDDPSVSAVTVENLPATLALTGDSNIRVIAHVKINGAWSGPEDWTRRASVSYCRDAKSERIEELILLYTNVDNTGDTRGFNLEGSELDPNGDEAGTAFTPRVRISNAGCWRWTGTASKTTENVYGGTTRTVATTIALERDPTLTAIDDQPVFTSVASGQVVVSADGPIDALGCTLTIRPTRADILPGDGVLTLRFNGLPDPDDPDSGEPDNRSASGGASTRVTVTQSLRCFGELVAESTGPDFFFWLDTPAPFGAILNSTGRTISFTDQKTGPDGSVVTSTATLTAEREP